MRPTSSVDMPSGHAWHEENLLVFLLVVQSHQIRRPVEEKRKQKTLELQGAGDSVGVSCQLLLHQISCCTDRIHTQGGHKLSDFGFLMSKSNWKNPFICGFSRQMTEKCPQPFSVVVSAPDFESRDRVWLLPSTFLLVPLGKVLQ